MRGRRAKPEEETREPSEGGIGRAVADWALRQVPGSALLREPERWAPVVPADLHTVKPATIDADGNVTCLRCGKATPFARAELIGSDGFVCPACAREASLAAPVRAPRSNLPWIIGGVLVCAVGVIVVIALSRGSSSSADDDDDVVVRMPPGLEEELSRVEAAAAELDEATRTSTLHAEPPWLVMEGGDNPTIRFDTRVLDRIEAADDAELGVHVLLAWHDAEGALADPEGLEHARTIAASLRPPAAGKRKRLPAGPRLTVGEDALALEGDHLRLGSSRVRFDDLCARAVAGENLALSGGAEVQAALVWLALRSESRRSLCAWEDR